MVEAMDYKRLGKRHAKAAIHGAIYAQWREINLHPRCDLYCIAVRSCYITSASAISPHSEAASTKKLWQMQ